MQRSETLACCAGMLDKYVSVCARLGVECTDMTYMCADGTCLKKPNPECDFVTDCPDASDEKQCGEQKNAGFSP